MVQTSIYIFDTQFVNLNNIAMFNTGLVDSLKIRVKLEKVKILDKRLITDFIAYYPDISALDDDGNENQQLGDNYRKAEPFTKIINGITYRFYIKAFIDSKKTAHEYVVFQISAKMLKSKYFEGITAFNYRTIVDDINSFGVLHISRGDFLEGLVSDIDICINQLIDLKSLKTAFSLIMQHPNAGKKPLLHYINQTSHVRQDFEIEIQENEPVFKSTKGSNLGMDFNKREKATNTAPYCKIYHKGFELLSKSIVFYKAFLEPMKSSVIDNLVRYEFTIKAHKHKEYLCKQGFKADFKTFADLLKAHPRDLALIAKSGIKHYIEPKTKSKVNAELNPMDIAMQFYIENLIKLGFDQEQLLGFTYLIDDASSRSRTKSKAKRLIDDLKNRDKNLTIKIQNNERSNKFLENIGVNL
ncbi:hypothetical protein [Flavobacterium sp. ov086]|uniref:hypothetical protein n=1 Tax=Flavobacterium sp. ov086 TaxID=1761785 RepID=UPI000B6F4776|nr:hypothetical protein [Flavobacterium sp. ov086]SNS02394.1 hypothetical protein SAMN04487979_1457 [Flavobacterium sp. ov086]